MIEMTDIATDKRINAECCIYLAPWNSESIEKRAEFENSDGLTAQAWPRKFIAPEHAVNTACNAYRTR